MRKIVMSLAFIAFSVIGLQACKTTQAGVDPISALSGEWNIIELDGQILTPPANQSLPYIGFNTGDRRIYGSGSCNRIMGMYILNSPGKLKFGDVASTMMMCPDMSLEQQVLEMLKKVSSFKFEHDNLLFYSKGSKPIAVLAVRPHKSDVVLADGVWNITQVEGKDIVVDVLPFIEINAEQQKVTGNAGCNNLVGSIATQAGVVRSMEFRDIAVTRMACPELELEAQVLQTLGQAYTFVVSDNKNELTLLNQAGIEIMQLQRNKVED